MPKKRPDAQRRLRQNVRFARLLRLLQLLHGRGHGDANDLARTLECGERTVYRDLQALELAGIPWEFDQATRSYRVRSGWHLSSFGLSPDEIVGQVAASAAAAMPGLRLGSGVAPTSRRLSAALTTEGRKILEDAEQFIRVLDMKLVDTQPASDVIRTAQTALFERKQVSGLYASPFRDAPTRVQLHPYRLCFIHHAWYLIGRPTNEVGPKTYRVGRFRSLRTLDKQADVPDEFSIDEYLGNAWAVFRGEPTYDIELLFAPEAAIQVAETQWHRTQQVRRHADGSATLTFRIDGLEEIIWWLLGWSGLVRVIKPLDLRETMERQLRQGLEFLT